MCALIEAGETVGGPVCDFKAKRVFKNLCDLKKSGRKKATSPKIAAYLKRNLKKVNDRQ